MRKTLGILDICRRAQFLGLELKPSGDRLLVYGKTCPPDFIRILREHKTELLSWLSVPESRAVPPANLPLSERKPSPTTADARRIMNFIVDQIGDAVTPLCEWCLQRENIYWDRFQWPAETCAYAAARDAACWQFNRPENEVARLLMERLKEHS